MKNQSELLRYCQQVLKDGANQEDIVRYLRTQGLSKVTSLPVLVQVLGISLDQAKQLVHSSATWNDVRIRDEKFQTSLDTGEENR
ncbi:MAG: hypothetical protein M9910_08990 [Kiritimatiellae bacterium]|nr:hypothetical protein [Kiritimatiellia bacterium]